MKKLKDLLNEAINPQLGKVYSDPYAKSFVKENEDEESSSGRFIPTEEISQDLGVSFPVDI